MNPESLTNLNLSAASQGLSDKTQGNAFLSEIISIQAVLGASKPGQLFNPPLPPPPPPLSIPPLYPNPGLFPDMEIDDELEEDTLWDWDDSQLDETPIAEC